jgi:hypothetical protein
LTFAPPAASDRTPCASFSLAASCSGVVELCEQPVTAARLASNAQVIQPRAGGACRSILTFPAAEPRDEF